VRVLSPTLRIVESIPGIDWGGAERTATSSGRRAPPNERPVAFSSERTCAVRRLVKPSGRRRPRSK
jgi:hypothetical protein